MKIELDFRDQKQSDFKAIRIHPETNDETGTLQYMADYLNPDEMKIISSMYGWHLLITLKETKDAD